MSDERKGPVVTFPARSQITKAVIRNNEMYLEIDMPGARGDPEGVASWVEEFKSQLNDAMRGRNSKGRTVEVLTYENDPAKVVIAYRTRGPVRLEEDRQALTNVLIECGVQMNNEIALCLINSFGKLAVPDLAAKMTSFTAEVTRQAEKSRTPRTR